MTGRWSFAGWVCVWLACASCAPAQPVLATASRPVFGDVSLAARVESLEIQVKGLGGTLAEWFGPEFLTGSGTRVYPTRLPAGSCSLLVGLAGSRVGDLDLYLYDENGIRIGIDQERDAHPTLVRCSDADELVFAVPVAYEGNGEVYVGRYRFAAGAAPSAADLDFEETAAPVAEAVTGESSDDALERLDRRFRALGFARASEPERVTLPSGGELSRVRRLGAGRCLGAGLVGMPEAQDLDLRLHAGARKVAEDREASRDAMVTWCAEGASTDLRVVGTSAQGEAEGLLVYYEAEPEDVVYVTPTVLPDEPEPPGSGPGTMTFEQRGLELDRSLRDAGYEREGSVLEGTLGLGQTRVEAVNLQQGACYVITALARPDGIRDLDLLLDDAAGTRVLEDREENNEPRLSFCPERSGRYRLEVQAYDGGGGYQVHKYRLGSRVRDVPGVSGRLASAYTQLSAELVSRGFVPAGTPNLTPANRGSVERTELPLRYGSCYVVAALASGDDFDLDIEVRDWMGRSLSVDNGGEPDARVFVCPARTAPFPATVTVANGSGTYLLAVFESKVE